jgi:hypothetical protein
MQLIKLKRSQLLLLEHKAFSLMLLLQTITW